MRTTLFLVPAVPIPITATVERDTLEVTLPKGGQIVDAAATHGDVRAPDGLLTIELVREVPEAMKPRKIAVRNGPALRAIDQTGDHQEADAA